MDFNSEKGRENGRKSSLFCGGAVKKLFQIFAVAILSLLVPLSFLLLARLATARYLLSVLDNFPTAIPSSALSLLFLYTQPTTIYVLVSIVSVSALTNGLMGKFSVLSNLLPQSPGKTAEAASGFRLGLFVAWVFLCVLQICVGLGIEESIAAGVDGSGFGQEKGLLCRIIFFFGMHETMQFWAAMVVKPVVDDTIFGFSREESWAEKAAMVFSFGVLWWWRLRNEVEALVVVPELKRELMLRIGVADFIGWWLYYLTVTIGMIRVVKGAIWVVMVLACRRRRRCVHRDSGDDDSRPNEEKV